MIGFDVIAIFVEQQGDKKGGPDRVPTGSQRGPEWVLLGPFGSGWVLLGSGRVPAAEPMGN